MYWWCNRQKSTAPSLTPDFSLNEHKMSQRSGLILFTTHSAPPMHLMEKSGQMGFFLFNSKDHPLSLVLLPPTLALCSKKNNRTYTPFHTLVIHPYFYFFFAKRSTPCNIYFFCYTNILLAQNIIFSLSLFYQCNFFHPPSTINPHQRKNMSQLTQRE